MGAAPLLDWGFDYNNIYDVMMVMMGRIVMMVRMVKMVMVTVMMVEEVYSRKKEVIMGRLLKMVQ